MKLKEIHRTATFAWSPTSPLPFLATGTAAGALDASFSNESKLEIWAPNFLDKDEYDLGVEGQRGPAGSLLVNSRFHRLAWGDADPATYPHGVLAAGMENGDLLLWDPAKIPNHVDPADSLILRNAIHGGPIRGLHFNPIQKNLLSSGGIKGEVYVWDLKDPSKPYSPTPGKRSTKLEEITSVRWNQQVQYVLAGSSSTGYTIVWDLRGKREVLALSYGGSVAAGASSGSAGMRRGMSDIAWHPDNATKLVTASEDDSSPIVMVWDLRNARAPEKILTGHEKGILSLSWCVQDADLLLSCGKDNRALCWNPQTSEIIGELPSADNWAFQVEWCPRNPDLLATAFFDGTIGVHSLQSTNETVDSAQSTLQADGADIFDVPGFARSSQGTFSLKQPPKWLRRSVSVSWGFGGNLVTVLNMPPTSGKSQSSVVHLRKVITENVFIDRAQKLQAAVTNKSLNALAEEKSLEVDGRSKDQGAAWKALLSLFRADSRDELVTLLGFSKSEVAARVAEAVANVKKAAVDHSTPNLSSEKPQGPIVSFVEPESDVDHEAGSGSGGIEKTPSEVSANTTSDVANTTPLADGESITTTAPSLFGDENAFGNPQDAETDFFGSIGVTEAGVTHQVIVPHHNYGLDSSVAATAGSGSSSVASENLSNNIFSIYPSHETDIDRLVTKALVLGDFESAVELCFSSGQYADAILLAVRGGPQLLNRTQKMYFDRKAAVQPYLRVFQSIVTNDLADIVENADLKEWQEIFVVLCTFATKDEFSSLVEVLGRRLEFQWSLARNSDNQEKPKGSQWRKNATITYLAAGHLERLVDIWIEELSEEETRLMSDERQGPLPAHTAHAQALQTFMEKVTIFRSAINYVDQDLQDPRADGLSSKLSRLYDHYLEYAGLLASQGLLNVATGFYKLVPQAYSQAGVYGQDQLLAALTPTAASIVSTSAQPAPLPQKATVPMAHSAYPNYALEARSNAAPVYRDYNLAGQSLGPSVNPYAHPQTTTAQVAPATSYTANVYTPQSVGTSGPSGPSGSGFGGPRAGNVPPPPPPPPKRRENGGWNDAPVLPVPDRRSPSMTNIGKPAAITSPFPNASPSHSTGPPSGSPYVASPARIPPPPRPSSVQGSSFQGGPVQLPVGTTGAQYSAARPASGPPGPPRPHSSTQSAIPPRMLSPPQNTDQSKTLSPPGFIPGQAPPPGQHARPPHGFAHSYSQASPPRYGRATPPQGPVTQYPSASQQGTYAPPAVRSYDSPQNAPLPIPTSQPPPPTGLPPSLNTGQGQHLPPSKLVVKTQPPPPKYPAGDRSHIPDYAKPIFNVLNDQLNYLRQSSSPQQKRMVDDLERRVTPLFDALNCETLSRPIIDQLVVLTRAMAAHDREAALSIHIDLLTRGSQTDDIGLWMSGIKQLINCL